MSIFDVIAKDAEDALQTKAPIQIEVPLIRMPPKTKQRRAISPASTKISSTAHAIRIYPIKSASNNSDTIGLVLTPSEAMKLSLKLLAVALDTTANGRVILTGKKKDNTITVLRNVK